jgi:hypothetical protein
MRFRRKEAAKPKGANTVAGYHNQRTFSTESRLTLICLLLRFLSDIHAHVEPRQALKYRC